MAKKQKIAKKVTPNSKNSQITDAVTQSATPTSINDQITDAVTQLIYDNAIKLMKELKTESGNKIAEIVDGVKRSFTRFFGNLFYVAKWIPHLWNNYWWDHSTLDAMLMYELRYRANRFRNFGVCEGASEHANEIDEIADALDDYLSNKLETQFTAEWEAKYPGFLKEEISRFSGKKTDKRDEALSKLFVKEYTVTVDKAYRLRREALTRLAEKSENWWD